MAKPKYLLGFLCCKALLFTNKWSWLRLVVNIVIWVHRRCLADDFPMIDDYLSLESSKTMGGGQGQVTQYLTSSSRTCLRGRLRSDKSVQVVAVS